MIDDKNALRNLTEYILDYCGNPIKGLPEDVFLMISALIPIANVDLFVFNNKKELLLMWRNDCFFGKGWSIPGGCMRFGERMEDRVHKTAINEIGVDVDICEGPITARDVIRGKNILLKHPNVRGHNVTMPYICKLKAKPEDISSQLNANIFQWFSIIPENILSVHHVYDDLFVKYGLMKG